MIEHVGIIGSGTMGSGIAQVAATAGCQVTVVDSNPEALQKAETNLERIMNRLVEKGRIDTAESDRIKQNIRYSESLEALRNSQLVIEAGRRPI